MAATVADHPQRDMSPGGLEGVAGPDRRPEGTVRLGIVHNGGDRSPPFITKS